MEGNKDTLFEKIKGEELHKFYSSKAVDEFEVAGIGIISEINMNDALFTMGHCIGLHPEKPGKDMIVLNNRDFLFADSYIYIAISSGNNASDGIINGMENSMKAYARSGNIIFDKASFSLKEPKPYEIVISLKPMTSFMAKNRGIHSSYSLHYQAIADPDGRKVGRGKLVSFWSYMSEFFKNCNDISREG